MKATGAACGVLCIVGLILAAIETPAARRNPQQFPEPAFVLSSDSLPPAPFVLPYNDRRLITNGSIASHGLQPIIQVASLSFSANGKLLAAGNTFDRVELWDVESRKKICTLKAGSIAALTPDGTLLAANGVHGKDIELWDVPACALKGTIPRQRKNADNFVDELTFNPTATLLVVTVNGEDDSIFDVSARKVVTTLKDTKHGRFSRDGTLLIGGSPNHLVEWNTKDWSVVRDLPIGPDYVVRIAAYLEKDMVLIGGAKSARLARLSSATEVSSIQGGYTTFAAIDNTGSLVFTEMSSYISVWKTSGQRICNFMSTGNGIAALSPDNRWLALAAGQGNSSVGIWDMRRTSMCGALLNEASVVPVPTPDQTLIAQGKARYLANKCDECHGANGQGGGDGPDLTITEMNAAQISKFLENPSPDAYMKGMPNIPVDHPDHQALVAYVVSLKHTLTPK